MKFSVNQSELARALAVVSKGVSTRSTLPVLAGILVEAIGDEVVFHSTDLELAIRYRVSALVEEEGRVVVPGKLFTDIVKGLPDAAVTVSLSDGSATVQAGSSKFSIRTLNADDFPSFPEVSVYQTAKVPFETFSDMVKRTARVASRDESRAILTGVLITYENTTLKMVATDSYRLAVCEREVSQQAEEPFEAVVAAGFLNDLAGLERSADDLCIALAENQIVITYQGTTFINRRIEGNYPNYRQLIPAESNIRIEMDRTQLHDAVKRASLLGNPTMPVLFDVNADTQTVQLSSALQDVGSAQESVTAEISGGDVCIAFNCSYVLDGLAALGNDRVLLEVQEATKPGVFRALGDKGEFLYLVMPVRVS